MEQQQYSPDMTLAELFLLLAVTVLPLVLGVVAVLLRRPWWWAAIGAVVIAMVAAIAPTPEAGEPRVAAGDLAFLAVVALWVVGLAWLGAFVTRWLSQRRHGTTGVPSP